MNNIKLIALDVDGTLTRNKKVNKQDIIALQKVMDLGIDVTLITGRNSKSVASIAKQLNVFNTKLPFISSNGAQMFTFNEDETINFSYNIVFSKQDSIKLFDLANKYNVTIFSYCEDNDKAYINKKKKLFVSFMKIRSKRKTYLYKKDQQLISPISKFIVFGKKKNISAYRKEVERMGFSVFAFSYFSNKTQNIEIVPNGVNKKKGLEQIANILDIKKEQVMYFGDGENDKLAIQWAGIGIAMGNANEDVKQSANYITDTFKKHGVANFINNYFKFENKRSLN